MIRNRLMSIRAAAVLLSACLVGILAAQSGTTTPQNQPPTFTSRTSLVRVDVYPTRDGKPVDDLRAEDFEVQEDGAPQAITAFEHIVVHSQAGAPRVEPNTIAESRQLAADARNRVFVLFLDLPHISFEASRDSVEPLIRLLDRLLGPDDLVGLMTPGMRPSDLVLSRKTEVLQSSLRDRIPWGQRQRTTETEQLYASCYGSVAADRVTEMTRRAQERATLETLRDLVDHLRIVREERKAILTISEGWQLYKPTDALLTLKVDPQSGATEPVPGVDPPKSPRRKEPANANDAANSANRAACERDQLRLSSIDDARYFQELIDAANRANASFYTIDPRAVQVFDASLEQKSQPAGKPRVVQSGEARVVLVPGEPTSASVDALNHRQDALRTLSANTDGIAVMNTELDRGLQRISDDMSSYYLLGYYSTNTKLDGKFRTLKVRIKQPGVEVRARRGYRAATEAEMASVSAASTTAAAASPVVAAVAALGAIRTDAKLYIAAIPGMIESGPVATLWVTGEMPHVLSAPVMASAAEIEVTGQGTTATAQVALPPGNGGFVTPVKVPARIASGTLTIRVHLAGTPDTDRETTRLDLGSATGQALLFRRGPTTGNRLQPAASRRFTRTERVHVEIPASAGDSLTLARLLDKSGQPLSVPITIGERLDEPTNQRWLTADLTLAPLAMGDYAIETTVSTGAGQRKGISAFRIVP